MTTINKLLILLILLAPQAQADKDRLAETLLAQSAEAQQRFYFRHPLHTLDFFGVEPGMTVMEALPGGGWYSKILLDYLGADGHLIGVDYATDMFPKFGFFSAERLKAKQTWAADWTKEANGWRGDNSATVSAYTFGSQPKSASGKADVVLFIRALHNLARFENDGGYLGTALTNAHDALKPGGVMGVVQHEARPERDAEWASGSRGYIKKAFVIAQAEAAGFEFIGESDVNQNDKDIPGVEDFVWRLPPNLSTSGDKPKLRVQLMSVGESNRMTLKFRKPKN